MSTTESMLVNAAAWLAIGATTVSAISLIALHLLSPEFQPSWRMVSEYANGEHRWVLTVVFLTWGLGSFALAYAVRSSASGWLGVAGLSFLILAGIGEAMGGLFDINHRFHGVAFALGVPSLPIAAILLTLSMRSAGVSLPLWAAALPIVSVVLMGVSMMALFSSLKASGIVMPTGGQSLASLPEGVTAWNGWANRFLFAAYFLWVIVAAKAMLVRT